MKPLDLTGEEFGRGRKEGSRDPYYPLWDRHSVGLKAFT